MKPKTKIDKMFEKKNLTVLSEHYAKLVASDESDNESDDLLVLTRKNHDLNNQELPFHHTSSLTHRQILKSKQKELKKRGHGRRMIFDENGEVS